jgi:hypothetical protein
MQLDWQLQFDRTEKPIPKWCWVAETRCGTATIKEHSGGYKACLGELEQSGLGDIHAAVKWIHTQLTESDYSPALKADSYPQIC